MAETYHLHSSDIDLIAQECQSYFETNGIDRRLILQNRLTLEECLLQYREAFGEDTKVTFRTACVVGQLRFLVMIEGSEYDPFLEKQEDNDIPLKSLLNSYETNRPSHSYRNRRNEIQISASKPTRLGLVGKILIALAAAMVLGLCARWLPSSFLNNFLDNYIDPLVAAYAGLFCVMAVLLVFFDMAVGAINLGDLSRLNKVGKKLVGNYMRSTIALVLILAVPVTLLLGTFGSSSSGTVSFHTLFSILLGFIPDNFVSPFLNFTTVQILIIGAMCGIAMLALGEKSSHLQEVFREANSVAALVNGFINKFIAIYVFLSFFSFIAGSNFARLASVGILVVYALAGLLLMALIYLFYTCAYFHISPIHLIKKTLPSFLVALASASWGSAFTMQFNTVLNDFGVEIGFTTIGIELGGVLFKPAQSYIFFLSAIFMSDMYHIDINASWVIIAFLLSLILSYAVPNIPGGAASIYGLLFSQLGLGSPAIALMITINALLQFPILAVNNFCMQCQIALTADSYKSLDRNIIQS